VHLIEESPGATLRKSGVIAALDHVEGTYGIAVVPNRIPEDRVARPRLSRACSGRGGEFLVASTRSAVLGITRSVVY